VGTVYVITEPIAAQCIAEALAAVLGGHTFQSVDFQHAERQISRRGPPELIIAEVASTTAIGCVCRLARTSRRPILVYGVPTDLAVAFDWEALTGAHPLAHGTGLADFVAAVAGRLGANQGELPASSTVELTDREREILALVAAGGTNAEIAGALQLQQSTVKNHIHRILTKLGVRSRTEAAARYGKGHGREPQARLSR
jgi:DNA-binding CsgD family transcriptional regulator